MPQLSIDDKTLEVADGTTLLEAAGRLGIEIPTLCHLAGYEPSTSCQVCLVKDRRNGRLLPSCATRVVDGMLIESETEEVHAIRRTALELLFSDHVGDCLAPCFFACPAHMDIPLMLEQIGEHEVEQAIATVKQEIALPAVLGRVCSKPCEKGCRRNSADGALAVCDLKRFVADADLARENPFCPPCKPDTGKAVAIVGAGPTGLSAAYYLRQEGHACVVLEKENLPGGRLRLEAECDGGVSPPVRGGTPQPPDSVTTPQPQQLPPAVLDQEIEQILRLGIELRAGCLVEDLDMLAAQFDAVLLSCGHVPAETLQAWGLNASNRGIEIDKDTLQTNRPAVFAAGSVIRHKSLYVRSVADGKLAAQAIHQFLSGQPITPPEKPFSSRIGALQVDEAQRMAEMAGHAPRHLPDPGAEYSIDEAAEQSDRCFSCGCISHGSCKLERYAVQYGADPTRFAGERKPVEIIQRPEGIRFEPNKCIKCELCIQIATRASEPLGLTFVGRGFDVQVTVPFTSNIDDGLTRTAAQCVEACPTGALSWSRQRVDRNDN